MYVCLWIVMGPTCPIRTTEPSDTILLLLCTFVCLHSRFLWDLQVLFVLQNLQILFILCYVYVCLFTLYIVRDLQVLFVLQNLYYCIRLYVYIVDCEGSYRSYRTYGYYYYYYTSSGTSTV